MQAVEASARVNMLAAQVRQHPDDIDAIVELADVALDYRHEDVALPCIDSALENNPGNAVLWQWKALLHRSANDHGYALAAFKTAVAYRPDDPLIVHSLARTSLEAGLPAAALFARAVGLAPANGEIRLGRAAALAAEGHRGQAMDELNVLLGQHPGWYAGHETLARMRWLTGDSLHFVSDVEHALKVSPRDPELWRVLLTLLIHADRFDDTLVAAAHGRSAIGDHLVILVNEAAALSELGRHPEANALFERLHDVREISLSIRHIRHCLRTGQVERAVRLAQSWTDDPMASLIWPYLGLAWRLLGDSRAQWFEGGAGFVSMIDLAPELPPLDRLAALLSTLHDTGQQPLDQSVRGGTQTDGHLFQRVEPELIVLKKVVASAVSRHIDALPPVDPMHPLLRHRRDERVGFNGAWSVRLRRQGRHANHVHPQGWISSALYVQLPARTKDDEPTAGWLTLGAPQSELGLDLSPVQTIEPRPGLLVLFPSTMWHGTVPFEAGERITVAFDVATPLA